MAEHTDDEGDIGEGTWEVENGILTTFIPGLGGVFKPTITDGSLSFELVASGWMALDEITFSGQGSQLEDTDWIGGENFGVLRFNSDGTLGGDEDPDPEFWWEWEWDGENVKMSLGIAARYEVIGDALTIDPGTRGENTLRRQGSFLGSETIDSQEHFDRLVAFLGGSPTVEGDLRIAEATDLTSLQGLADLTEITGRLVVDDNSSLTSLEGLHNVESVGASLLGPRQPEDYLPRVALSILDNEALMTLQGLRELKSVGGGVEISRNAALTNLDGLGNVTSIWGFLRISDNDAMVSLEGLSNQVEIGDFLYVSSNDALASLEGLNSIERIGGDLYIEHNATLTSLEGLRNLTSVGDLIPEGRLSIRNNPALPTDAAQAFADRLIAAGFTGDVSIAGNQP